ARRRARGRPREAPPRRLRRSLASAQRSLLARHGQVVARAGAVAGALGGVVAPQALDGIAPAVVARDVVQAAGHVVGGAGDARIAHPRALVAVLVAGVVVPAAEVVAVDDVLGAGIGDGLLDLVA